MQISTIGLDIAKNVFQVHGVDARGNVVVVRQSRRGRLIAFFEKLAVLARGESYRAPALMAAA